MQDFPLFPEAASTIAPHVDALYVTWSVISLFFSALIAVLILVFFVKFRQRAPQAVGREHEGSTLPLEITWSVIPLVIALTMFGWGAKVFFEQSRPPADAVDYFASAKQWMWKFQHPEGIRETNDLHVPVGQAVRMTMTSQDVIHSLYLPAFRVKMDVVPGRYTTLWFRPTKPGAYHLFCAEYCGTEHSKMGGTIYVMEKEEYDEWLVANQVGNPVREQGEKLFAQLACDTCHRTGEPGAGELVAERGPRLDGLVGRQVTFHDGRKQVADMSYVRESILDPQKKIVAGWQPVMPTYRGQVDEEQILALVAYIRSLGSEERLASTVKIEEGEIR